MGMNRIDPYFSSPLLNLLSPSSSIWARALAAKNERNGNKVRKVRKSIVGEVIELIYEPVYESVSRCRSD